MDNSVEVRAKNLKLSLSETEEPGKGHSVGYKNELSHAPHGFSLSSAGILQRSMEAIGTGKK